MEFQLDSLMYFVGQTIEHYKNKHDTIIFDVTDTGTEIISLMANPTLNEIKEIQSLSEIRMNCFPDILWMSFGFKTGRWFDAPFNPHFSHLGKLPDVLENACSNVSVIVIDTVTGTVCSVNRMWLPREFRSALKVGIMLLQAQELNTDEYDYLCAYIKHNFSIKDIVNNSLVTAKLI